MSKNDTRLAILIIFGLCLAKLRDYGKLALMYSSSSTPCWFVLWLVLQQFLVFCCTELAMRGSLLFGYTQLWSLRLMVT